MTPKRYTDAIAIVSPNLTLSGDVTNAGMGTNTFASKREVYRRSSIGITRSLADETVWNEEALERRAELLARRALDRWPWSEQAVPARDAQKLFHAATLEDRGRSLACGERRKSDGAERRQPGS